jgi:hypothetical protein
MIRRYLSSVLAVAVAMLIALPGTAHADGIPWYGGACATGSFDPATVDDQGHIVVPGHMTLCSPYNTKYNWTVVRFRADHRTPFAFDTNLRHYAPSGPADLTAVVIPLPWETHFGLCLMSSLTTRTACVRVDFPPGGPVTTTPIAATDPLVTDQVVYYVNSLPSTPDPMCATCVSIP